MSGYQICRVVNIRCAKQRPSEGCSGFSRCALCCAVDALCEVSAIDTLLSNFIRPLQGEAIATVKRDPATSQPILGPHGRHHRRGDVVPPRMYARSV